MITIKVQILTRNSHHLTFLFKYFHDHSLTQVGLPIFEWEMLKLFIHLWMEKNSACVSDIRSYGWLLKDTIDDNKVQILTWNSHRLTFLFTYFHNHSLTQLSCLSLSGKYQSSLSIFEVWPWWQPRGGEGLSEGS